MEKMKKIISVFGLLLVTNFSFAYDYPVYSTVLKNGLKAWQGTKEEIFKTNNEAIVEFVYSSNLFKKVREAYLKG